MGQSIKFLSVVPALTIKRRIDTEFFSFSPFERCFSIQQHKNQFMSHYFVMTFRLFVVEQSKSFVQFGQRSPFTFNELLSTISTKCLTSYRRSGIVYRSNNKQAKA